MTAVLRGLVRRGFGQGPGRCQCAVAGPGAPCGRDADGPDRLCGKCRRDHTPIGAAR